MAGGRRVFRPARARRPLVQRRRSVSRRLGLQPRRPLPTTLSFRSGVRRRRRLHAGRGLQRRLVRPHPLDDVRRRARVLLSSARDLRSGRRKLRLHPEDRRHSLRRRQRLHRRRELRRRRLPRRHAARLRRSKRVHRRRLRSCARLHAHREHHRLRRRRRVHLRRRLQRRGLQARPAHHLRRRKQLHERSLRSGDRLRGRSGQRLHALHLRRRTKRRMFERQLCRLYLCRRLRRRKSLHHRSLHQQYVQQYAEYFDLQRQRSLHALRSLQLGLLPRHDDRLQQQRLRDPRLQRLGDLHSNFPQQPSVPRRWRRLHPRRLQRLRHLHPSLSRRRRVLRSAARKSVLFGELREYFLERLQLRRLRKCVHRRQYL